MPMQVEDDNVREIVVSGNNVKVDISRYSVNFNGKELGKIIQEKVGVKEWEDQISFRGNVRLVITEIPSDLSIESDFIVEAKEESDE